MFGFGNKKKPEKMKKENLDLEQYKNIMSLIQKNKIYL